MPPELAMVNGRIHMLEAEQGSDDGNSHFGNRASIIFSQKEYRNTVHPSHRFSIHGAMHRLGCAFLGYGKHTETNGEICKV